MAEHELTDLMLEFLERGERVGEDFGVVLDHGARAGDLALVFGELLGREAEDFESLLEGAARRDDGRLELALSGTAREAELALHRGDQRRRIVDAEPEGLDVGRSLLDETEEVAHAHRCLIGDEPERREGLGLVPDLDTYGLQRDAALREGRASRSGGISHHVPKIRILREGFLALNPELVPLLHEGEDVLEGEGDV